MNQFMEIPKTVGVSELRNKTKEVLDGMVGEPVAILVHDQIRAVMLSTQDYNQLIRELREARELIAELQRIQ